VRDVARRAAPSVDGGRDTDAGWQVSLAWPAQGTIGIAGCTLVHLHFELRRDGIPIDPTLLIVG
jgi:hypothetical protein